MFTLMAEELRRGVERATALFLSFDWCKMSNVDIEMVSCAAHTYKAPRR
jgi:hypothetical protein